MGLCRCFQRYSGGVLAQRQLVVAPCIARIEILNIQWQCFGVFKPVTRKQIRGASISTDHDGYSVCNSQSDQAGIDRVQGWEEPRFL